VHFYVNNLNEIPTTEVQYNTSNLSKAHVTRATATDLAHLNLTVTVSGVVACRTEGRVQLYPLDFRLSENFLPEKQKQKQKNGSRNLPFLRKFRDKIL